MNRVERAATEQALAKKITERGALGAVPVACCPTVALFATAIAGAYQIVHATIGHHATDDNNSAAPSGLEYLSADEILSRHVAVA